MDYDDNDISLHNIQLAGEGRTKSSSVLRPYDFPKFDFGESLQGHLKFDSLVETEAFLGIQSQEDSHWIEDFSRGSNGMEFNSTPADSCLISQRNNVWSEATSSESVEMLLKSVGQEETMPKESIILETKSCDDQVTLTEQVAAISKKDEISDVCDAKSVIKLPQDEFSIGYPSSKMRVEAQNENPNLFCGKDGISANEGNHSSVDGNFRKSITFVGAEEDSLHVTENFNYNAGDLSPLETSEKINVDVSLKSYHVDAQQKQVPSSTGKEDNRSSEGNIGDATKNIPIMSSSVSSVKDFGGTNNQDSVEARVDCLSKIIEGESKMIVSERGGGGTCEISNDTVKCESEVSSASRPFVDPLQCLQDGSASQGLDQHSNELYSVDAKHIASLNQKRNPCLQVTSRSHAEEMKDISANTVDSDNITQMHIVSGYEKKLPSGSHDCVNGTDAIKSTDMSVLSSAAGNKQPENLEGCFSDSIITTQHSDVLLPIASKNSSKQVSKENLARSQIDFSESEHDIYKVEEKDEKLHTDAGYLNSETIGQGVTDEVNKPVVLTKEVSVNDEDGKLQHQTAGKMKLEKDMFPRTHETTTELEDDPQSRQGESTVIVPYDPDNCEDTIMIKSDVNLSIEGDSISKIKDITSPLSEIIAKPLQPLDNSNAVNIKSPSMEDINSTMCPNDLQVDIGCNKSSSKEGVNVQLLHGGNQDATMMKLEGEKKSPQVGDVDKTSCGSPTIISSSKPSQMDKEQQVESRDSVITDKIGKENESGSKYAKPKGALGEDTGFTFKVNAVPDTTDGEPGKSWSPFVSAEKCKQSSVVEEASPSVKGKAARTPSKKTPRQSARGSDGEPILGTPKGTSERKGRRTSVKGAAKENAKKGNKETDVKQEGAQTEKTRDKISNTLLSTSSSSPHAQPGRNLSYGFIEQSNSKISSAVAAPHLSTNSTSKSASFRQPFTDLQQVQLRAQIFVYGSLIQGIAPDEACMTSAFGPSDGGRGIWEPVWRAAAERIRNQKSNSPAAETPLHARPGMPTGAKASDSAVKQSSQSNKVVASPVCRSNSKSTTTTVGNPIIPLSSALWSVSTPFRDSLPSTGAHKGPSLDYPHTITPLHSYQTPPVKNFMGQTAWPQTCFPGPWLASPQTSTFNSGIRFQSVAMAETGKLTPAKGTSVPLTSGITHATPVPAANTLEVSRPVREGASSLLESKPNASAEKLSVNSKPKKRKKASGSDGAQISLLSEVQREPVTISNLATNLLLPVALAAPASPSPIILNRTSSDVPVSPADCLKSANFDTGKAITIFEAIDCKVSDAKGQAEDAAALASAAVSHSENLWGQLVKHKECRLTSESEVKLVSAEAAIAAAASVAKAAAAAAKVAYSAALQAKQMADEVFVSSKTNVSGRSSLNVQDIGNATQVSILKGDNIRNQSNPIVVAAKEAAKRRVEAASAASNQAENFDAVVKAAELAAAAAAQAGRIVAMGEPLSLSDLIKAGPEGNWKLTHPPVLDEKVTGKKREQAITSNMGEDAVVAAHVSGECSVENGHGKTTLGEKANDPLDGHVSPVDGIAGSMQSGDRNFKSKRGCKSSEVAKSSEVDSELETTPRNGTGQTEHDEFNDSASEDNIKEGSLVEVFKHGDGLKSAWYSANVLRLADGKAYVCYSDLLSEQDSANLCEWVTLEVDGNNAPIIRAAHPSTTLPFQATRKRRRAALGDYAWSVGARVDVWIDDCWWEGVVTEKNEKDETTLNVHFPAQGEVLTVRAWNMRTSRIWKDGKWVEWSSSRVKNTSEQSDTPQEKRQKLGNVAVTTIGMDKSTSNLHSGSGKPDEAKLLGLSASEKTFNIGKETGDDKKRAAQSSLRSGPQKGGSKVIFGVPKPTGKKRKFMEVSKHFPASRSEKSNETNDSVKFAKYLMPQATASRGWKAPLRNDSREKRTTELRSRIPSSRKPNQSLLPKDKLNPALAQENDKSTDYGNDVWDSAVHEEDGSETLVQPGSSEAPEAPLSLLLASTLSSSSKKISLSNKTERANKGKLIPSGGKMSKIAEEVHDSNVGNSVAEVNEPRRSNRRIQPTHRLLEGLQSSMIIPKMPSVSLDKGPRSRSSKGK